jgi:5-methylthioadenosine/S-adenosylhomocysteine deaminase
MKERVDLLIHGGIVLTMNPNLDQIDRGAVAIKGDSILAVGSRESVQVKYNAHEVVDIPDSIVMPGLINTHTHAPMSLFRGLADDLPLMEWLKDHIFPAEARLTEEMVYWGALLACGEMILSGTTTFCDMYLFEEQVARAAKRAGMRALVGEVLYDFPSPNYGPPENGLVYTRELIERWKGDSLISIGVEPHALFTCSPQLLKDTKNLAQRYNVPLIVHLSETKSEVDEIIQRYGATPVCHLNNIGLLDKSLIAIHCVNLTDHDMDLLAERDVKVVHCPESNMKLASGFAPIPDLLRRGVNVSLGTDGPASNNNLDLFQEMDIAAKLHKLRTKDPTVTNARQVLRMATIDAAKTLGLERDVGSIEKGKKADIVIVDTSRPHLTPMYDVYSHLVYAANGGDVVTSIINGQVIMKDRNIFTFDIREVMERVNRISKAV